MSLDDYASTAEAAAALGYSLRRVQQLVAAGALGACVPVGRSWLIPRAALAAYQPRPRGWKKGRPRKAKNISKKNQK